MFLGRSYFFIIIKKTVTKSSSLLMFRVTVPAAKIIIRYQIFGQVINRVAKNADFGHKWGKSLGKWSPYHHSAFLGVSPGIM